MLEAYSGLLRGAFFKQRGLSETLVATTPYILLSLGVAVGFKAGLFNIGVEGQFYIGAIVRRLGRTGHSPACRRSSTCRWRCSPARWAARSGRPSPAYLKATTGAHEVITHHHDELRRLPPDRVRGQRPAARPRHHRRRRRPRVDPGAELWSLYAIPQRLHDPLNALGVALVVGFWPG